MNEKYRYFKEMDRCLMNELRPSEYLNELVKNEKIFREYPFNMLNELENTLQSPKYHPEGSVWSHTMMVVDNAALRRDLSENPRAFMWAALLHDIGKPGTTRRKGDRVVSYDHDVLGARLAREFLEEFDENVEFISAVSKLVRWHMQALFVVKDLPYAKVDKMLREISLEEVALLALCDRLGRGEMTKEKIKNEEDNIDMFIKKCRKTLELTC
ncbi:multifunctional CCA protein [Clostridium homopropionicum DSM 5847]|uniref:Multifunctional CCA protein n=1 Tax=Clostridium homopropionicum DSM 5847 TaxID=1121318 RepID=A0A0L6Z5A8_9CLOT|nr:HDIG domain-containing metalloprotein [Clostridium homopropionicum]KOA18145.1 multifunctional CCA protein [Clostridium homopropionicum DSM 5847]SFG96766.1 HDIG domain-containing protein [Clostridium homopropionicum]